MKPGHEKDRFEFQQQYVEHHTERLTELTEKPGEEMKRDDIITYTNVTKKVCMSIYMYFYLYGFVLFYFIV
jgi:hypothetical protein